MRKGWCLTINNYKEDDEKLFNNPELFEYSICGKEVGKEGTPHLQCYVHYKKQVRFATVKKYFSQSGAHIEPAEGNASQNKEYCSKDGDFVEFGTCPLSGPQKIACDWEEVVNAAKSGDLDSIDPEKYVRYYSTLKKIHSDHKSLSKIPELTWTDGNQPNEWIYGPTGTGKSMTARRENPEYYYKMNNKWWERYIHFFLIYTNRIDIMVRK